MKITSRNLPSFPSIRTDYHDTNGCQGIPVILGLKLETCQTGL